MFTRFSSPTIGIFSFLSFLISLALANTEKNTFLGPQTVNIPPTNPNLEDLQLDVLSPGNWSIRTHLKAAFPSGHSQQGKGTWLLLDQLVEGQRYEVRVCWAATQPTAFSINTYELPLVFDDPDLITELASYSASRISQRGLDSDQDQDQKHDAEEVTSPAPPKRAEREASVLFLQILAAADYYTTNRTLMTDVPPVLVDIILDPFVLNILPRSLIPTIGHIVLVAILSWFIGQRISLWICRIAKEPEGPRKTQ